MKTSFVAGLLSLWLVSCGNVAPTANTITPPIPSVAVAPIAAKSKAEVIIVKESNQLIEKGLNTAINEISRLSEQKTVSEEEFKKLWDTLTGVQARVAEQWTQIKTLEKTNDDLTLAASASDIEKTTLRNNAKEANDRLLAAVKWQEKNASKVAIHDWIVAKMWLLAIIVVIGGIAYLAFLFFKSRIPRFPF